MGFKCKEFKEIADNLPNFKSLPNEGRYRTAIGRYYYYTFLTVRDMIYKVDKREDVEKYYSSGLIHSFIRIYLYKLSKNIGSDELNNASRLLSKLHFLRKLADYNTNEKITYKHVLRAKRYSQSIIETLNTLEYNGVIGFENILKHLKKIGEKEGDEYKYFPRISQLG
jgi:hypothetical protein